MRATANRIFLDATYLIALASPRDQHHAAARALMEDILARGVRMITTRAVLLEFANSLAHPRTRRFVAASLQDFERDPLVEIVPLTDELFARASVLYGERPDKSWGLTDCASFVVMRERELTEALTADEHFEQAGFVALIKT